jgi:pimeloyl-ACP methyl ester carboxylesterase
MQTSRVNGYDMAYLEIGQGPPLVCIHGTLGDFRTWSAVLGPLWLFLPELFSPEEVALLAREAEGIYDTNRPEVWREKSGAPRTAFAAHLYNEAFACSARIRA